MKLEPEEEERLDALFVNWWLSQALPSPEPGQTEPSYTAAHLLPGVVEFVRTLERPFLMVRGDGGPPSLPLIIDGLSYFPDLEIVAPRSRYVAVEVKFLRDLDPTGALAKAIGQGVLYRSLGVRRSHIVLIDLRQGRDSTIDKSGLELMDSVRGLGIAVHWFVPSSGGLRVRPGNR